MTSKSKSAIAGDGKTIDISKLQREIQADVATYHQHKAEDGMKKRAIHSSKDYDEFRNFVSVSQLKPTNGRDVSSLFSGASGTITTGSARNAENKTTRGQGTTIGGFDDLIQRRKSDAPSSLVAKLPNNLQSLSLGNVPISKSNADATKTQMNKSSRAAYDFLREWKKQCKTAKDTLSFLTRIKDTNNDGSFIDQLIVQPDPICKEYFATDIDNEILGGIVEALHLLVCPKQNSDDPSEVTQKVGYYNNCCLEESGIPEQLLSEANAIIFTQEWLKALTTCGRFELSVSFLMPDEQTKLKEVCNFLKSSSIGSKASDHEYLLRYDSLLK